MNDSRFTQSTCISTDYHLQLYVNMISKDKLCLDNDVYNCSVSLIYPRCMARSHILLWYHSKRHTNYRHKKN